MDVQGIGPAPALRFVWILFLFFFPRAALAQSDQEKEPAAVLEIGAAPGWSLSEAGSSLGPTVALEFTPIKHWLELEVGVTQSFGRHSNEWSTDLLFKKPWDLTSKVEFMAGIGPEWMRTRSYGVTEHSLAGEAVLDFMFWTNEKHRLGWYLEPSYDYSFRAGHERSAGISIGLLIGIR
jgi:hypothetical protein